MGYENLTVSFADFWFACRVYLVAGGALGVVLGITGTLLYQAWRAGDLN